MKFLKIIIFGGAILTSGVITFNTLIAENMIAIKPIAGLPTTTWSDVGKTISSFQQAQSTNKNWSNPSLQQAQNTLVVLGKRAVQTASSAQNIIGSQPIIGVVDATATPTASDADKTATKSTNENLQSTVTPEPFYTKALDYGKYVYCQEVVKNYEAQHPESKKP